MNTRALKEPYQKPMQAFGMVVNYFLSPPGTLPSTPLT